MNAPSILRYLLLAALLIASGARAANTETTVIELHYAEPAAVVAALQDVVGSDGAVHAVDSRLVISARPGQLAHIRQIVADLDRQPRTLLISVRTDGAQRSDYRHLGVHGQWGNDSTRIVVNRDGSRTETHTRVTLQQRGSGGSDRGTRTIRALEGRSAYISVGEAVPEYSYRLGPYGQTGLQRDYVPVERGFSVTARVHGDRVVVSLDYRDHRRADDGTIHTNSGATQLTAPLGQWFAVGGVEETGAHDNRRILDHSTSDTERSDRVWLRVELAR